MEDRKWALECEGRVATGGVGMPFLPGPVSWTHTGEDGESSPWVLALQRAGEEGATEGVRERLAGPAGEGAPHPVATQLAARQGEEMGSSLAGRFH